MPSVTIEQKLESRQTFLRVSEVGRLLKKPEFRISADTNEMLGPFGWKNQAIVNRTRQVLSGSDLILEVDPRLVSYIETGRAIEVSIEELGLSERILPPPLMFFSAANAPGHPDAIVYDAPPSQQRPPEPEPVADDTRPVGGVRDNSSPPKQGHSNSSDAMGKDDVPAWLKHETKTDDDATRPVSDGSDEDDPTKPVDRHETDDDDDDGTRPVDREEIDAPREEDDAASGQADTPPAAEAPDDAAVEPVTRGYNRKVLAAALGVGLILGFFGKYFADEYGPWPNSGSTTAVTRKLALLQADAFAPLSEDLKQVPDKSPLGVQPDSLPGIGPFSGNRSPIYFNQGARKAMEGNKREAAYWYKRALLTLDPNVLAALGDSYLSGEGVPRDARTGYQFLRLAAGLGSEKARAYLVERLEHGSIPNAPPTIARAFHSN